MKRLLKELNQCGVRTKTIEHTYVQSDLAVTPAKMLTDSEHGIPIKSQIDDSLFYDGDLSESISCPIEYTRGMDINDAWNAEMDAKTKLSSAQKKDISIYGITHKTKD